MIHLLEIEHSTVPNGTGGTSGIATGSCQQPSNNPLSQKSDGESVANLLTALTLTDTGVVLAHQHSKLWSSSDEYHDSISHLILTAPGDVPLEDVQQSVQSIIQKHRSQNSASLSDAAEFPRIQTSTPLNGWARKANAVLAATMTDIRRTTDSLTFADEKRPPDNALQKLLDDASAGVEIAGRSLVAIKNNAQEVLDEKKKLMTSLSSLEARISQLRATLPLSCNKVPVVVETSWTHENPAATLDTIAQVMILLGAVCHVIFGLSTEPCDFIIKVVTMIVKMALASVLPRPSSAASTYNKTQIAVLDQLPTSLYTALDRLRIEGHTTMFATCPSCNYTHEPIYDRISATFRYPTRCVNRIAGSKGPYPCHTQLLETHNGKSKPIKPFVAASFPDYLARSLADPEVERLCKQACREALENIHNNTRDSKNIFDSAFMKSFEGPTPGKLFIDSSDKIRLAFSMHVDFFNPNGTRRRGNHDSIGVISLANLNLPEKIRYLPEHIFVAGVIPGPREPELDELNHFIRPIITDLKTGWDRGFRISHTADAPEHGKDVEVAIVLSVNDLPAARKVSGMAASSSRFYCSLCDCTDRSSMYNTAFDTWTKRDVSQMKKLAESWRDAGTTKIRNDIFHNHGIRWSELWRLPYWNPTQMLVIDSMHCILEGLVHYHCRRVLQIDADVAQSRKNPLPAFAFPHRPDPTELAQHGFDKSEIKRVTDIERLLTLPFNGGDGTMDEAQLLKRLCTYKLNHLKVIHSALDSEDKTADNVGLKTKKDLAKSLVEWRYTMPLVHPDTVPEVSSLDTLEYIQHTIKTTVKPSWIHSVPLNYGNASAGSIKADEWRILSTVYLPIALVTLWGDHDGAPPVENSYFLRVLDHTMALFQAVTLVVRYTMNGARIDKYRQHMKEWVDGLSVLHPHTKRHSQRPNVHAAFHVYDFLILFGPVISWWCFPFERLIGQLESTLLLSHMKAANLRRWLNRPDCPEVLRQFKHLFDKAFSQSAHTSDTLPAELPREVAHYTHKGITFSRSSTHVGNSLIIYYPLGSSSSVAGSIEKLTISSSGTRLYVRRQAPLPADEYDPFCRYPSFPAKVYSSNMDTTIDDISFESVISHVARFDFSANRCVVLNLSRI